MTNTNIEHEISPDSIYRIFRNALGRKKFGSTISIVASKIRCDVKNDPNFNWSEYISNCDPEAQLFWSLVADELKKS